MRVADRLAAVQERIRAAEERAGRAPGSVTLVAVSKRKPATDIIAAYEAGQRDFGENYVQEFAAKDTALGELKHTRFHFIGKLQSNKSNKAASLFDAIHTIDRVKLARRLGRSQKVLDVFVEVKLSHEPTKGGAAPQAVAEIVEAIRAAPSLRLRGLMTMPPWNSDPSRSRPYFRRLREIAAGHGLSGLSMGMSHDLEVAIDEGATHVRVGTAIFGKRDA
ncbi:MAG: YggS family pyridoxal phosphate-dependent enzyme [Bryobacterales bacterium]|nr:YggS family pyridoxal phosphate-dependent enzyme [Bryobacterales bacterium]